MDKVRDQTIVVLVLVCIYLTAISVCLMRDVSNMQEEQEKQRVRMANYEKRMHSYEKRTTDALDNWDSMRKTQLVLMDLLQARN